MPKVNFITYGGSTHTVKEWASITGLSMDVINYRLKAGKSIDEVLKPGRIKRQPKKNVIWMYVSQDRYSLPEIIADSADELAKMCNTSTSVIYSTITHYKTGRLKKEKYVKVVVDDGDDSTVFE